MAAQAVLQDQNLLQLITSFAPLDAPRLAQVSSLFRSVSSADSFDLRSIQFVLQHLVISRVVVEAEWAATWPDHPVSCIACEYKAVGETGGCPTCGAPLGPTALVNDPVEGTEFARYCYGWYDGDDGAYYTGIDYGRIA